MRKFRGTWLLPIVAILLVGLISCEGPEGPAGGAGAQGSKGDKGDNGEPGTSGIIYSDWKNSSNNWVKDNKDGIDKNVFTINAPALSAEILNRGTVLVYAKFSGDETVRQLPYHYIGLTEAVMEAALSPNAIKIIHTYLSPRGVLISSTGQFRYILIPGGQATSRVGDLTKLSYEEVKALYGIED